MIRVEMIFGATTYYFSNAPLDYADKYWEPRVINDVELSRQLIDTEKSGSYARSVNLRLDNRDGLFDTLYTNNGLLNQYVTVYFGDGSVASKRLTGTIEKINEFGLEVGIIVTESILPYLEQNIPDEQIAYDYYSDMGINDSWEAVPIVFGTIRRHKTVPIDYVNFRYAIGSGEIYKVHKIYFGTTVIYNGDASPVENGYQPEVDGVTVKARIFKGAGWGGSPETITDDFGTHTSQFPGMAYIEFYDATTGIPTSPQLTDNSDPEVFVDVSGIVNAGKTDAERNPAQLIYWLLTNPTTARNISGGGPNGWGLGIPSALVSCTTAIADCAALGLKIDGVIDSIREGREWIDELAKCCRGSFSEEEGVYTLSIDKAKGASVATFDESGAEGYNCSVEPWNEPELSQQINRLKVKFSLNRETGNYDKIPDPATIYTEDSTHALRINKWNNNFIELPFVQDEITAAKLGQYYFKKVLKQLKEVTLTTEVGIPDALDKGSHVKVTSSKYLWSAKSFIVQEIKKTETKTVLRLKEYDATIYDYTSVTLNYPTPVVPPSVYAIPAKPTNFSVTSTATVGEDGATKVTLSLSAIKPTVNAQAVVFFRKKVGDSNFSYFTQSFTGSTNYQWDRESGCYYIRAVTLSPTGVYSKIDIASGDTHYKGQPGAETYLEIKGDITAPGKPTVTAQPIINGASLLFNITGGIPSDFNHFSVERAPACCGVPDCNNICIFNANANSQLLNDIQPNSCYSCWFYRVKAYDNSCNASCYSEWSSMVVPLKVDKKDIVFGAVDTDILTSGQIYAKDFRTACNVGNGIVSGIKFDTYGIEGWNGCTKNFCLSAVNGSLFAQNATISGNISATSGNVGGWCVEANKLYSGIVGMQSYTCSGCISFYAGCSDATKAPFRVTNTGSFFASNATISGAITATSGSFTGTLHSGAGDIAGWTINTDSLSGVTAGHGVVTLNKAGYIGVYRCEADSGYGAITIGNCLRLGSGWSNLYNGINIIKNGSVDVFSAYTRLSDNCFIGKIAGWTFTDSVLSANNITLNSSGSIYTSDFASGLRGWCINCYGNSEFNNVIVRGELRSSVFAYDEITAIGGQMIVAEAGILANCWTIPALNACNAMCVKNSPAGTGIVFSANDIVRVKTFSSIGIRDAWAKVITATACTGYYLYCVQLMSGSASSVIPAGVAVANYGPATDTSGAILLNGQGSNSPFIDIFTNGSCPWCCLTPRVRLGNLCGIAGMTGYGLWTNNGYIVGGVVQSTNWGASAGSCFNLTDGCFALGGSSSPKLSWNGTTLSVSGNITITGGSGIANFSDAGALATVSNLDGVPDGSIYSKTGKGGSLYNNYSTTGCITGWTPVYQGIVSVTKDGVSVLAHQVTSNCDAQVLTGFIPIDPSKAYQLSLSICRTVTTGSSYFGIYVYDCACNYLNTIPVDRNGNCSAPNNNFYFWSVGCGNAAKWYDLIGYVLPAGTSAQDIPPGKCVGLHAIIPANARYIRIRYLNFYNNGVSSTQYYYSPSIVPVDVSQAGKVFKGLDSNGTLISRVVPAIAATPGTGSGLFLGCDYLGYYDGSAWKTYMDNTGKFYLSGASGGLAWNGSSLTVCGTVCATSGTFTGTVCSTAGNIGGLTIASTYICKATTTGLFYINTTYGSLYTQSLCCNLPSATLGQYYWCSTYQNGYGLSITNNYRCQPVVLAGTAIAAITLPDSSSVSAGCSHFWVGDSSAYMKYYGGLLTVRGIICATGGTFDGAICSCSGCIAAFFITGDCLYSCAVTCNYLCCSIFTPNMLCLYRCDCCACATNYSSEYYRSYIDNTDDQVFNMDYCNLCCYSAGCHCYILSRNIICGNSICLTICCSGTGGLCGDFYSTGYLDAGNLIVGGCGLDISCNKYTASMTYESVFGELILSRSCCNLLPYRAVMTRLGLDLNCGSILSPTTLFSLRSDCIAFSATNPYICAAGAICVPKGICGNLNGLSTYAQYLCVHSTNEVTIACGYNSTGALYINYRGSINSCPITEYRFYNGICTGYSSITSRRINSCISTSEVNLTLINTCCCYYSEIKFCTGSISAYIFLNGSCYTGYNGACGMTILAPASVSINAFNAEQMRVGCDNILFYASRLCFSTTNPYICASSYIVVPGGMYINGGTFYVANMAMFYVGICNNNASVLQIAGGCTAEKCTCFGGRTYFGSATSYIAPNATYLQYTTTTGSVCIGSGNSSWIHIYGSLPFYFSRSITVDGEIKFYNYNIRLSSAACGLLIYSDNVTYAYHRFYSCQGCLLGSIYGTTSNQFGILDCAGSWMIGGSTTSTWICKNLTTYGTNCTTVALCNGYAMTVCNSCNCCGYGIRAVASGNYGVYGWAACYYGVYGCATRDGVHGSACYYGVYGWAACCYGVYGAACYYGVYGCAGCGYGVYGFAPNCSVAGNTGYNSASSESIKFIIDYVDVLPAIRNIRIPKYVYQDRNATGHDMYIGPLSEDIQREFKLTFGNESLYTVDGIALKAAQELDTCVETLKCCINDMATRLEVLESKLLC